MTGACLHHETEHCNCNLEQQFSLQPNLASASKAVAAMNRYCMRPIGTDATTVTVWLSRQIGTILLKEHNIIQKAALCLWHELQYGSITHSSGIGQLKIPIIQVFYSQNRTETEMNRDRKQKLRSGLRSDTETPRKKKLALAKREQRNMATLKVKRAQQLHLVPPVKWWSEVMAKEMSDLKSDMKKELSEFWASFRQDMKAQLDERSTEINQKIYWILGLKILSSSFSTTNKHCRTSCRTWKVALGATMFIYTEVQKMPRAPPHTSSSRILLRKKWETLWACSR